MNNKVLFVLSAIFGSVVGYFTGLLGVILVALAELGGLFLWNWWQDIQAQKREDNLK